MVESTGLENRRCESIRGFESHSLRQKIKINMYAEVPKWPKGSPAKGVGRQKRREGSNPSFRASKRDILSDVSFCFMRLILPFPRETTR